MIDNEQIYEVPKGQTPIANASDFMDHVGTAAFEGKTLMILPKSAIAPEFFDLKSGLAGDMAQKLVNYHLKCAIIGDFSAEIARSNALRDFIYESNRGPHIRFVASKDEIEF